jgi:predicted RNA-binding Zn-ribbon protein involved in translation (DUF1610 family)
MCKHVKNMQLTTRTHALQVEFGLPDLESRTQIFQIHTRTMSCERDIRYELLARLCPNSTGADIRRCDACQVFSMLLPSQSASCSHRAQCPGWCYYLNL